MNNIITNRQPSGNTKCIVCGNPLKGRQSKYCSTKCKTTSLSSYPSQKERGAARKLKLVNAFGGKCSICGYNKCLAALEFHHTSPDSKSFQLDTRSLSNRSYSKCLEEAKHCILVCANCHRELHNADSVTD